MAISREDLLKVAHLARIELNEEELNLLSGQFADIVDFIDKLKRLDVSGVEPMSHVLDVKDVFRPDAAKECLSQEAALKNAPEASRGHFRVPKVIE